MKFNVIFQSLWRWDSEGLCALSWAQGEHQWQTLYRGLCLGQIHDLNLVTLWLCWKPVEWIKSTVKSNIVRFKCTMARKKASASFHLKKKRRRHAWQGLIYVCSEDQWGTRFSYFPQWQNRVLVKDDHWGEHWWERSLDIPRDMYLGPCIQDNNKILMCSFGPLNASSLTLPLFI